LATIASKLAALNTPYPEKRSTTAGITDQLALRIEQFLQNSIRHRSHQKFLLAYDTERKRVAEIQGDLNACNTAFTTNLRRIKRQLRASESVRFDDAALAIAFAQIASVLHHKKSIELRHSQIIAARAMLHGRLAEMATGEGKTYAALLAAATVALAGIPVHVMTANEYLAVRDAHSLNDVLLTLGLSSGVVTQESQADERREIYKKNIVYCTATEVIFDYLKDRLIGAGQPSLKARLDRVKATTEQRQPVLRGLCFALVDEADSILIDEASTPFILAAAQNKKDEDSVFSTALNLAKTLNIQQDYIRQPKQKSVEFTDAGKARLNTLCLPLSGMWKQSSRYREELVSKAIAALICFERDVDYVVMDNTIHIVDENTGRIAEGRQWSDGLHQMIEIKEGVSATQGQRTIVQLTYQRFFPRYLMLAGMSGTLKEGAKELRLTYGLTIEKIAPFTCNQRQQPPVQIFANQRLADEKFLRIVAQNHALGRPILIGTDSVDDSTRVSHMLTLNHFAHSLLNAREHEKEAAIVAQAGQIGKITVATNMAGRGTDIALGDGVKALGGLLVISCQSNSSARIDRQLSGRSARRGDPGCAITLLNVKRGLLAKAISNSLWNKLAFLTNQDGALPGWLGNLILRICQSRSEAQAMQQRIRMMKTDEAIENSLSFGGRKD
jgi:preprotein translocase subunit SecA